MRSIHLLVGVLTVTAFLATGQIMRHHTPPMGALSDAVRLMYRSRHASGLVNLMLGLYIYRPAAAWRDFVQAIGSGLILASPALLIIAFSVEPQRGFKSEMWWSTAGLYALFLGCMAHLVSGIGASRKEPGGKPTRSANA